MLFRDLDIPKKLADALESQGFRELYPPQEAALPKALSGNSVVAAVPTASGKSMIGFIPALKTVMNRGGRVLYIVPLKALATEKRDDLSKFAGLGVRTVALTGDPDRDDDVGDADIVIATSEKADSMIRHGNRWLDRVRLLIADEVHMISDPGRGPTLEIAMTKMMSRVPGLQVIALSATISNSVDLAHWLNADLVRSDWRPTKLKQGVYLDGEIEFGDGSFVHVEGKDPVNAMVKQTIEDGGQCLVFVNSRRSAESVAYKLRSVLKTLVHVPLSPGEKSMLEGGAESTAVGRKLAECVECGSAFHHAGLDYNQRRMIEDGFKSRLIKCIVATPTLAAGINLPARRVVVRDTSRFDVNAGNVPISVMEVKQMCGRAGRPGYDPWGEAVLVAKSYDARDRLMDDYIFGDTERLTSKLGNEDTLRSHILGLIATEDANSPEEISEFLGKTFYGSTSDLWGMEQAVESVTDYLVENGMVEGGSILRATAFGKRVSDLYIDPRSAVILRKAVMRIDDDTEDLPIIHAAAATPDILGMYPKKADAERLKDLEMRYASDWLVDLDEEGENSYSAEDIHMANLKTAEVLWNWISEKSEDDITGTMGIGPGDIRARVDNADWILYGMSEIAYIFNPDAVTRIKPILKRMRYGIKEELIPLVSLRGIGRSRARLLYDSGFHSCNDIARADVENLSALQGIGKALARNLKEQVGAFADEQKPKFEFDMDDDEAEYMLERMAAELDPSEHP